MRAGTARISRDDPRRKGLVPGRLRIVLCIVAADSVLAACGATGPAVSSTAVTRHLSLQTNVTRPAACLSGTCYVAVSMATAWVKPWHPRTVDRPALGNPAHPGTWAKSLTVAQKAWLVGKLETQALYGTRVMVTGHRLNWTHVVIPDQPTNRDRRGYPGWVPTIQLTRAAPPAGTLAAVVRTRTAWLRSGWTAAGVTGSKLMLASYDTRLPVIRVAATYVLVTMIGGRKAALPRGDVIVHTAGTSWGATRATVHGTAVRRAALKPGDLVSFRSSAAGPISHVGLYVGGGQMIDAPNSSSAVRIEPLWPSGYAGARRFLSR